MFGKYNNMSLVEAAGKLLTEDMQKKGMDINIFQESLRFKEDVTTANASALYITALASVIRAAVEPNMVALELLQKNTDLMNGGGKGAIKLPKELRVVAAEVSEGGTVVYTGQGYESITVTPTKKIAASKITWEMVHRGMISMIAGEAARAGKAIARKTDKDILDGVVAVCTAGNSNRNVTGGASTRISYSNVQDLIATVEGYDVGGFKVSHIVMHPDDYAALTKDTDFKQALYRVNAVQGGFADVKSSVFPIMEYFGDKKLCITAQVASGTTLAIDSNELGTFVQESDVEVVDGRIPGTVDTEVLAVMSYGIGIQNVRAAASCIMASS